jgi:hypothetical protein
MENGKGMEVTPHFPFSILHFRKRPTNPILFSGRLICDDPAMEVFHGSIAI